MPGRRLSDRSLARAFRAIEDPRVEVVSFDVFDTLLVRPVLEPIDLFHLVARRIEAEVGHDFVRLRRRGESEARHRMRLADPAREEPTLAAIYAATAELGHLSTEWAERLMRLEIETERSLLTARRPVRDLFARARELGKPIVAISDTYMSPDFVGEVLDANGYDGLAATWVSSHEGRTKASGNLFTRMLTDLGLAADRILHIGDNLQSDVRRPEAFGLRAVHVPRAAYLYFTRRAATDLWGHDDVVLTPGHRLLLGMAINRCIEEPMERRPAEGDPILTDPEAFGYALLGPLLVAAAAGALDPKGRAAALVEAILESEEEPSVEPASVLGRLVGGAERCRADAAVLFGPRFDGLDLDGELLLRPLLRALRRSTGTGATWSADLELDWLLDAEDEDEDGGAARLSLKRRAELRFLKPFVTPNRYLHLVHSAPQFFSEARNPLLRLYARARGRAGGSA